MNIPQGLIHKWNLKKELNRARTVIGVNESDNRSIDCNRDGGRREWWEWEGGFREVEGLKSGGE
ncbi:hypothetical protein A2U01_0044807 [Trifolium medium]|uniref:Uncharacterized protein n=1 Tax=Trifolium medium TaxID=97028 RepID=A0A392QK09_9FABA|nr:hypothetical protein [Trifolium medium]